MNRYFILAPRQMSDQRLRQLLAKYLRRGSVLLGIAHEKYVAGFENQPQFQTLRPELAQLLAAKSGGRLEIIEYALDDGPKLIKKLDFDRAIVVNGSFSRSFHLRPEFAALTARGVEPRFVSPFASEAEARQYATDFAAQNPPVLAKKIGHESELKSLVLTEAKRSFDSSFQTAALATKLGQVFGPYHNQVVPYETYAWHHGNQREIHRSGPGDIAYFDTVHAETALLIAAGSSLQGATVYMRTFPCPHCARNLIFAGVAEIVYDLDYSNDYGYKLFDAAGIKYRRFK